MPEITIRPATQEDIESLRAFEHGYYTEYVWQMSQETDGGETQTSFRRVRLPRKVFVSYPRKRHEVLLNIEQAEAFLLAELGERPVGYIKIIADKEASVAKVTDLVVSASMRRQGIASGLLLAGLNLAINRKFRLVMLEIQSKNNPAIEMAAKLGFSFCGFRDYYFPNQELALFYSRFAR
ncbi:MAG: GNAT family N-acetyltransferase [Brevefilum sp.]